MGGAEQAGKDPSVLSAVLLQKRRRGEKTLILVKRLSGSEELTSRLSVPRSARTSRTSRKAPCLGTSCKPLWSRPRSTRSRSGHSSSPKTGPSTGGSRRNCLFLPRGPRMKVPSPSRTLLYSYLLRLLGPTSLPECCVPPAAAWSPNTLIYCFIAMFVATVFYTIYCAVTACQRFVLYSFLTWRFRPRVINGLVLNGQEGDSVGGLDPISRQKQDHV